MIVKDKQSTIVKANEVSTKLIEKMNALTIDFDCDDDPAEQIYLACHIVGSLTAKICLSLHGYGKTYGIPKMNYNNINDWIESITKEYIRSNKKTFMDTLDKKQ